MIWILLKHFCKVFFSCFVKPLFSLVQVEALDGLQFAHAQLHRGPVSGVRSDLGFLKLLAGGLSNVAMAAAWIETGQGVK